MNLKVIGAGFGRTGTLSLKLALEQLGFGPCYHMMELFKHHRDHLALWATAMNNQAVDWDALFADYQSTVDWPSCNQWKELATFYPDSKVIINHRDPESWYTSVTNTIYAASTRPIDEDDKDAVEFRTRIFKIIWDGVFNGRFEDKDYAISIYNQHVKDVISCVSPDRLLVFDGNQSWEPLCEFLDCPIPDQPFPQANSTEEFKER